MALSKTKKLSQGDLGKKTETSSDTIVGIKVTKLCPLWRLY